jgi:hypothetical protein
MSATEMQHGHATRDRIRNDDIRDKFRVAPIQKKLIQHCLRWFGRRSSEALVRGDILRRPENTKSGRG